MAIARPDERLGAAAAFVRQGAVFADIGTDHAYLPIFLLKEGRITTAVAADVNQGPLDRARANAEIEGLADKIDFRLANGLQGMESLGLTDIAICGMGGELIAAIIDQCPPRHSRPFVREEGVRLILQPMTRTAYLRRYLAREGFAVDGETICRAAGRIYVCISAHYTGVPYKLTDAEAECGHHLLHRAPSAAERLYVADRLRSAEKQLRGLESARAPREDLAPLRALIGTINAYMEEYPS